jgi:hypothetical protein
VPVNVLLFSRFPEIEFFLMLEPLIRPDAMAVPPRDMAAPRRRRSSPRTAGRR